MSKAEVLQRTSIAKDEAAAPLAVTVTKACQLSGFGPTSIWAFLKNGRLKAVRVPGVRRTLVNYASLAGLLATPSEPPQIRKRGQPRKDKELSDVTRQTGVPSRKAAP
jgi:hypothetical protein